LTPGSRFERQLAREIVVPLPEKRGIGEVPKCSIFNRDALDFLRSVPSESVDLIATDPAYSGMNNHMKFGHGRIVGAYKERGSEGKWFQEFEDSETNYGGFLEECKRVLKKDSHLFVMFDSFSMLTFGPLVQRTLDVKNVIVWDKVNYGMGHNFRRQSEFIVFASKGKRPLTRRDFPDVWRIKRLFRTAYPTQKPSELFEAMIAASKPPTAKDFLVCDPFVGSGSSAVAAIRRGCAFVGSDVSPRAVALAEQRVRDFIATGSDPLQPASAFDETLQKNFL
jgi:site-specific DNA-methyltransferase (adenine-specific)